MSGEREPFTRNGKEVLSHGVHYADGADETAATFMVEALNAHARVVALAHRVTRELTEQIGRAA